MYLFVYVPVCIRSYSCDLCSECFTLLRVEHQQLSGGVIHNREYMRTSLFIMSNKKKGRIHIYMYIYTNTHTHTHT